MDETVRRLFEEVVIATDDVRPDPDIVCKMCENTICTAEDGDTFDLLARTVLGHFRDFHTIETD